MIKGGGGLRGNNVGGEQEPREGWAPCPKLELDAGGSGRGRMGSSAQCRWKRKSKCHNISQLGNRRRWGGGQHGAI